MRKILFIITMLCAYSLQAQDVIVLNDATEFEAKVLEVNENNVRYKNWSNINGPTYTIGIDRIFFIRYSNGTKDIFNKADNSAQNIIHDATDSETRTTDYTTIVLTNGTKIVGELICKTNTTCFIQTKLNDAITPLLYNQIKTIKYADGQIEDMQDFHPKNEMPAINNPMIKITKELYLLNGNTDFMHNNSSLFAIFDFDNAPFEDDKRFKEHLGDEYISIVKQIEQSFRSVFNEKSKGCKITDDVLSTDYFVIINFVKIKETWRGGFWWSANYPEAEGHIEIWEKKTNKMIAYLGFDYEGERDYVTSDRYVKLFNELAEKLSKCQ